MKKIRKGVFETNSSSTHSICIDINETNNLDIPNEIHTSYGEYGWEHDRLETVSEKASYLFTGLKQLQLDDTFNEVLTYLKDEVGIDIIFEETGDYFYEGYIDHCNELMEFLTAVCSDYEKLKRFLFSKFSFILTGNDNDDYDVTIEETPDRLVFKKWN